MQIISLYVENYKCLKDFYINFTTDRDKGYSHTVLIGENGSGKSSIIEAITLILMSYDSSSVAKVVDFSYELEYVYASYHCVLSYYADTETYKVFVQQGDDIVINRVSATIRTMRYYLSRQRISLFPSSIINYCSGTNERLDKLYRQREQYYLRRIRNYLVHDVFSRNIDLLFPRKKYWYNMQKITAPILLALLLSDSDENQWIKQKLDISQIESFQVEIDTKSTLRYVEEEIPIIPQGNLDYLFNVLESLDSNITKRLALCKKRFVTSSCIRFHMDDFSRWPKDGYSILDFFDKLSLLFNVKYCMTVRMGRISVNLSDFSEGQRQLINTLGLLSICKAQDSLVFMDEPDVYLNPKWKYEYLSYLDSATQNATNTQVLISTHDPLMINGLGKDYIRKLELKKTPKGYKTDVYYPIGETQGLGIDGLLQSEYYGLKTSYDTYTSNKYERRAELYSKLIHEKLTECEKRELAALSKELGTLTAMNTCIDYLYDDFILAYRNSPFYFKDYLTGEEVNKRNEYISKLISELFENK